MSYLIRSRHDERGQQNEATDDDLPRLGSARPGNSGVSVNNSERRRLWPFAPEGRPASFLACSGDGMTAFAFDLAPDRLAIASDSAIYTVGTEARLIGFSSKVFTIPRLRFMLCGRGIIDIAADVHHRLAVSPVATFAEAVELMPALLRDATDAWAEANGVEDHRSRQVAEMLYGGYDREAGRARLFAAYNYEDFVPQELPAGAGCGVVPTLPAAMRPNIDGLPPRKRMLRGLRAAARYVASDPTRAKGAVIGGECEMTTVRASGISTVTIGFLPVAAPDPVAFSERSEIAD